MYVDIFCEKYIQTFRKLLLYIGNETPLTFDIFCVCFQVHMHLILLAIKSINQCCSGGSSGILMFYYLLLVHAKL